MEDAMRISQEQRAEIVNMYTEQGMTAPQVAKRIGVGSTTVYRILKQHGITPSDLMRRGVRGKANRRFTDAQEAMIALAYQEGASMDALGREHGVDRMTIRNVLKRQGIGRRRPGPGARSFTPEQVADMAQRWQSGESQATIAAAYHTGQTVVSRVLRDVQLDVHPRTARGEKHGNWNGGRFLMGSGYVYVQLPPDSPFAAMRLSTGYVAEHRLVMAEALGRPLMEYETVHHINGDRADNRLENLQLRIGKHGKHQAYCCADCGSRNIVPCDLTLA
jgi:transposase-like protein